MWILTLKLFLQYTYVKIINTQKNRRILIFLKNNLLSVNNNEIQHKSIQIWS